MSNPQQTEKKYTVLDDRKLTLTVKNEEGKRASLIWGVYKNNPRITVYTGITNDKDYGRISGNMDTKHFFALLYLINEAVDFKPTEAEPEYKKKIVNLRNNFKKGDQNAMIPESEIWVGKDREGVVWLSCTAHNRPRIKFTFMNNEYHAFYHASGEQFSKGEMSVIVAKSYVKVLENLVPIVLKDEYQHEMPRQPQGGGNNNFGGGNRSSGYNNNNQNSAPANNSVVDEFDTDIPF